MLFIYLLSSIIIFALTNVLRFYAVPNLVLYHFYTLFELILISYYIIRTIFPVRRKILYLVIAVSFSAFCLVDVLLWEPLNGTSFNSNTATLSDIILLFLAMYYMYQLTKTDAIMHFQKMPAFWFITAFLVSCAMVIPLMLKYSYYAANPHIQAGSKLWTIMDISYILKFTFISISLLCYKKDQKSYSV